jgi:capsular exopolysaccharide synthesis family protein
VPAEELDGARPADVERTNEPIIFEAGREGVAGLSAGNGHSNGVESPLASGVDGKWVIGTDATRVIVEQYRRLAATLHEAQCNNGIKIVMIASAQAREGKTLTSANLGLTLSQSYGRRVLLIDCDLRRPTLHEVFSLPNVSGLNDGLKAGDDRKLTLLEISPRLALLPAGKPDPDPMIALTSDRMRRVIKEAAKKFDWVILDTPPVGFLSDAHLLAGMVDAALLIVQAGRTPYALIERAIKSLDRNRILGVVLNGWRSGRPRRAAGTDSTTLPTTYRRPALASARDPRGTSPMIRMLKRTLNRRSFLLIVGEAALVAGAVVLGVWIRLGTADTAWVFAAQQGYFKTAVVTGICLLCLYFADLYNLRQVSEPGEMFVRLIQGLGAASIVLALLYFWFPALMIGRGVFLITSIRHRGRGGVASGIQLAGQAPESS